MRSAVLLLFWSLGCQSARGAAETPLSSSVAAVGMTVSDVDHAMAFYSALGFERVGGGELQGPAFERLQNLFGAWARVEIVRLGTEQLRLTEYMTPRGRLVPPDSRSNDLWFQHIAIVVSDMEQASTQVRRHRIVPISTEPQRLPAWNLAAAGIEAFYFRDPDGHPLELIRFPPGKGDPRWQARSQRLFLGIDHTAIAVADTETSLALYRDLLGMKVIGTSENYGPEQEHLNGVFGSRVRITSLRSGPPPGIELLEYLTPRDGRPMPSDVRSSDLVHWEVTFLATDLDRAVRELRARRMRFVSPGIVALPSTPLGFRKAALLADPDGHRLAIGAR